MKIVPDAGDAPDADLRPDLPTPSLQHGPEELHFARREASKFACLKVLDDGAVGPPADVNDGVAGVQRRRVVVDHQRAAGGQPVLMPT